MPSLIKCSGLRTNHNELAVPEGALVQADNVNIDQNDTITPRRGFKQYGDDLPATTDRAKQLMVYKDTVLRHYGSSIQYDSDAAGTFAAFSGSYSELETGLRLKYFESNSNFYFTTDDGIKKMSATSSSSFTTSSGFIVDSGMPKGLDIQLALHAAASGFLTVDNQVAYRVVWGYTDDNNNLLLGSPSDRVTLTNPAAGATSNVDITFTIPQSCDSITYFYQIYRTGLSGAEGTDPGDEMNLVYEEQLTSTDITNGYVNLQYEDYPESFRESSAPLYTNETTGDGILQGNDRAPVAKDVAVFRESSFYANTKTLQRRTLTLTSADSLVAGESKFIIGNDVDALIYNFEAAEDVTNRNVKIFTEGTVSQNIRDTAQSLIHVINRDNFSRGDITFIDYSSIAGAVVTINDIDLTEGAAEDWTAITSNTAAAVSLAAAINTHATLKLQVLATATTGTVEVVALSAGTDYNYTMSCDDTTNMNIDPRLKCGLVVAYYGSGANDLPGIINFEAKTLSDTYLDIGVVDSIGGDLTPTVSEAISISSITAHATAPVVTTSAVHGLSVGDEVYIYSPETVPVLSDNYTVVTVPSTSTFTISETVTTAGTTGDFGSLITCLALANDLKTKYNLHCDDSAAHDNGADAVNKTAAAAATDLRTLITIVTELLTDYEAHHADALLAGGWAFHTAQGTDYSLTSAVAPTTLAECATKLADLRTKYNLHHADATAHTPVGDDTTAIAAPSTFVGYMFKVLIYTDNEVAPNRLYFSKTGQPEAVPSTNWIDIGPKDSEIKRIIALRDNLFVLKENSVYIVSGSTAPDFQSRLLDSSFTFKAADTAVVLNNQIFALTNQGVVTISDTGVEVMSRSIEDLILGVTSARYSNFDIYSFSVAYESDRAFHLWLPTGTSDTYATQCYRYNIFNRTWTRWDTNATCGVVNPNTDKLYLGLGDNEFITQERKNDARSDYSDLETSTTIAQDGVSSTTIQLDSITNVDVGDALVQTQYVTAVRFNRLLNKLDNDPGLTDTNYYSLWALSAGDSPYTNVAGLMTKLTADDSGQTYTYDSPTTFAGLNTTFNGITAKLNAVGSDSQYSNYETLSTTVTYEAVITDKATSGNLVTVSVAMPFLEGEIVIHDGYTKKIVWAPQHFGDPSIFKHVREGSFLFDGNTFTNATASFASDLSQVFEEIDFDGAGVGTFGSSSFGDSVFGGDGTDKPFRTLIPRQKQRCRYISCKFQHINAREKFVIVGITLTMRPYSTKAYRGI